LGQLISLITVILFSFNSFAQNGLGPMPKTDFAPLIDQNILDQELTAEDVSKSTLTAANVSDEHDLVESVQTVPTEGAATTVVKQQSPATRNPANEKDFQLKLHPTGIASAKRYFPPKPPKPPKIAKTKTKSLKSVKSSRKVAESEKTEKKVKNKKSKSNGRSTASVKKKTKKSKI